MRRVFDQAEAPSPVRAVQTDVGNAPWWHLWGLQGAWSPEPKNLRKGELDSATILGDSWSERCWIFGLASGTMWDRCIRVAILSR